MLDNTTSNDCIKTPNELIGMKNNVILANIDFDLFKVNRLSKAMLGIDISGMEFGCKTIIHKGRSIEYFYPLSERCYPINNPMNYASVNCDNYLFGIILCLFYYGMLAEEAYFKGDEIDNDFWASKVFLLRDIVFDICESLNREDIATAVYQVTD